MRLPRRILIRPLPLLLLSHSRVAVVSSWLCPFPSRHSRLLFSSDSISSSSSSPDDDQLSRWEQLYQQGEQRRNFLHELMNDPDSTSQWSMASSSPIQVVTFDLDNTLWNTGATIGAANDVLAQFLNEHNIVQSKRTEKIMGDLFQANKLDYCPLATDESTAKAPVLLTRLRKDALQQILIQDNGYSEEDAKEFADQAFDKVSEKYSLEYSSDNWNGFFGSHAQYLRTIS
jgi:hypothetical protein